MWFGRGYHFNTLRSLFDKNSAVTFETMGDGPILRTTPLEKYSRNRQPPSSLLVINWGGI